MELFGALMLDASGIAVSPLRGLYRDFDTMLQTLPPVLHFWGPLSHSAYSALTFVLSAVYWDGLLNHGSHRSFPLRWKSVRWTFTSQTREVFSTNINLKTSTFHPSFVRFPTKLFVLSLLPILCAVSQAARAPVHQMLRTPKSLLRTLRIDLCWIIGVEDQHGH